MIALEKFDHKDIPKLLNWVRTPELLLQWCGRTFKYPLDEAQLKAYIDAAYPAGKQRYVFKAIDDVRGIHFGNISLDKINSADGTASVTCVIIGEDDYKGKGYSKLMMDEMVKFASGKLGLKRLYLNVFDFNQPAMKSYKRSGFTEIERKEIEYDRKQYINIRMELMLS